MHPTLALFFCCPKWLGLTRPLGFIFNHEMILEHSVSPLWTAELLDPLSGMLIGHLRPDLVDGICFTCETGCL